ncbi:MAG: hypothetical protein N4A46_03465 [Schleiferiaceae bacterium]|nr:hypothetical protein [Schleiferiaceae bacterium]
MKRILVIKITALTIVLFACLGVVELSLRVFGFSPQKKLVYSNEPLMYDVDQTRGWKNKPGAYTFPPYHPSGKDITMTFLDDERRVTSSNQKTIEDTVQKVITVGGSFTQGWAISDEETYSWGLQNFMPNNQVINYGTGGYGTYQSLLTLEEKLPELVNTNLVVYGFIEHHETRNVASAEWLSILKQYSKRGHVSVPYLSIDENNELNRHQPEEYSNLPLTHSLVLMKMLDRTIQKIKSGMKLDEKEQVTQKAILEMNNLCAKYESDFLVAILNCSDVKKQGYLSFFENNGIKALDCTIPLREELIVKGEGHPNGILNSIWAEQINNYLNCSVQ